MFINIQFHQKIIYLSLLCCSPKMRYIIAEFLIVLIHSRKPGNGHLKFSGFFLKSWISRQHQNLGLRYVSVQGITAPYVGRYDNTYWLDILVIANYCSPGHQLLPLASPRTILGVSGNNQLAITLIPVNKCIILSALLLYFWIIFKTYLYQFKNLCRIYKYDLKSI